MDLTPEFVPAFILMLAGALGMGVLGAGPRNLRQLRPPVPVRKIVPVSYIY